jgi:hypothetical protein
MTSPAVNYKHNLMLKHPGPSYFNEGQLNTAIVLTQGILKTKGTISSLREVFWNNHC